MEANHQEIIQEMTEKSIVGKDKMSADLLKKLGDAIDEYKQTAAPQQEKR